MRISSLVFTLCIAFSVTGCLGSGGGNGQNAARVRTQEVNQPPTITGSPAPTILFGEPYEFTPAATDPDGDTLEFQINGKPAWASFDPATGRLWGTPDAGNAGNFTNIRISVADGKVSIALTAFSIAVNAAASGSATLSWNPPTQNADGSTLTTLSGYRIYYGRSATALTQSILLGNPGLTRHVIENLMPAKWHFAMTSVNVSGAESKRSKTISKRVA